MLEDYKWPTFHLYRSEGQKDVVVMLCAENLSNALYSLPCPAFVLMSKRQSAFWLLPRYRIQWSFAGFAWSLINCVHLLWLSCRKQAADFYTEHQSKSFFKWVSFGWMIDQCELELLGSLSQGDRDHHGQTTNHSIPLTLQWLCCAFEMSFSISASGFQ